MRPSGEPPYSSVRRFVYGLRNWLIRKPCAPCSCMPLNAEALATSAPRLKSKTTASISRRVMALCVPRSA